MSEPDPTSSSNAPPPLITIVPDDHHAEHVGWTADGRQFFFTTPFVPGGLEFLDLYLFGGNGRLLEARIDNLGLRPEVDEEAAEQLATARLEELGPCRLDPIRVELFQLERFGVTFGLVPEQDEEGEWWVILEPGNYMAFTPPWDGSYDT